MITNEVQYRATKAHLAQFDEARSNLVAKAGAVRRTKLVQLEIDAVEALALDLRNEIEEYEHLRSGEVSIFEASSLDGLAGLLVTAKGARRGFAGCRTVLCNICATFELWVGPTVSRNNKTPAISGVSSGAGTGNRTPVFSLGS